MSEKWPEPWYRILYAPWRMKYIKSAERVEGCVFCDAPKKNDKDGLIVYRGEFSYIILNRYPYNSGHVMIVPYRHVATIEELLLVELAEMNLLTKASMQALRRAYKPHGFNIGINIGEAAGAGIAGHVHIHIVPRWRGDTNFTVLFSATKVLPESIDETYDKLRGLIPGIVDQLIKEEKMQWDTST